MKGKAKTAETTDLDLEKAVHKRSLAELDTKIRLADQERHELVKEQREAKATIGLRDKRIAKLEIDLEAMTTALREQSGENETLRGDLKRSYDENAGLIEQLDTLSTRLSDSFGIVSESKELAGRREQEVQDMELQMHRTQSVLDEMRTTLEVKRDAAARWEREAAVRKENEERLEGELAKVRRYFEDTQSDLMLKSEEMQEAQSKAAKASQENIGLTAILKETQSGLEKQLSEAAESRQQIENLGRLLADSNEREENLQQEAQALTRAADELSEANEQVSALRLTIQNQDSNLAGLKDSLHAANEELQVKAQLIQGFRNSIKAEQANADAYKEQIAEMAALVTKSTGREDRLRERLREAVQEIDSLQATISNLASLEGTIATLEGSLEGANSTIQRHANTITEQEAVLLKAERKAAHHQKKAEKLEALVSEAAARETDLREQLTAAIREAKDLQETVARFATD
ncbi:MAG: hypothetical protein LN413_00575 [Candidatus Thermoplasmatota archaeon]|nr:hypothetical protein [Candidatus Thermoplasmatota archaeon]